MNNDLPDLSRDPSVQAFIKAAIEEDVGSSGDVTTLALVPDSCVSSAMIIARHECIVSGAEIASMVFAGVDSSLDCRILIGDGDSAGEGAVILTVSGNAASILTAERTALNFMQRMSGIASRTAACVKEVEGTGVLILDTRKTTPCMRIFEKYAVLCGGGTNHRFGLFDRILIKDNHRKLWGRQGLGNAVRQARRSFPALEIEIEVESIDELKDALTGSPDWVLLDNMSCDMMRGCVKLAGGKCKLEASGGIAAGRLKAVAETGIDAISMGALTHTVKSADLSLEFI